MATRIHINAVPEVVFGILDDPYAYPRWVIGTRRIRDVDASWPAVGACFHHSLGTAAGELHDSSKVIARERPTRMVLEVRFRPVGVARVDVHVTAADPGSIVTLTETPIGGPTAHLPAFLIRPVLGARNALSLFRLRNEAQRRVPPSKVASDT